MKYQVLARKYRPQNFTTLMGQEHVRQALENALKTGRLHHAYLFSGTRGVGKTTIARVLAKALNCEQGVVANPCGECSSCREIDQGRFADLIEVDAASRTKVEDTRELLENVQYAPAYGRYKIYLIDEVHMLSGHSFNALLKTLEEPPEHVKFLLATTDPQKLPVTVLSRCLKFNLKRLSVEQICQQLDTVLRQEQLEFEVAALKPIAIAADGSMRDALSLMDQAIAFGAGTISSDNVHSMLGNVSGQYITTLIEALAQQDGNAMIRQLREILATGMGIDSVLKEIVSILQQLALCQLVPQAIDASHHDTETLQKLTQLISPEDVQLYYQIALSGRQDLELSPFPQGALEMILLRMLAFRPVIENMDSVEINADSASISEKKKVLTANNQAPSEPNQNILAATLKNSPSEKSSIQLEQRSEPAQPQANNRYPSASDTNKVISKAPPDQPLQSTSSKESLNQPPQPELPPLDAYYNDQAYQNDDSDQEQDYALQLKVEVDKQTQKNEQSAESLPRQHSPSPVLSQNEDSPTTKTQPPAEKSASNMNESQTNNVVSEKSAIEGSSENFTTLWHQLVKEIDCNGLEREIFMHCSLLNKQSENDKLALKFGLDSAHKELLDDKIYKRLKQKLDDYFNTDVKPDFVVLNSEQQEQFVSPKNQEIKNAQERLDNARQSFINDPGVNLLVNSFDGKIIQESIKPI